MKNSKIIIWLIAIFSIFYFIGCGGGNNSNSTHMRSVKISITIPESVTQKLSKIVQKPDTDIVRVTLDVNSSSHIYMQNAPFTKSGNNWVIATDPLPVGEVLTFTAKAYNSTGVMVFIGEFNGTLTNTTSTIVMPLASANIQTEDTPRLISIVFNNYDKTDITFNIYNPNGDELTYGIYSPTGGIFPTSEFNPNQGTLHFNSNLKYISLNSTYTPPTTAGDYLYSFVLVNSDNETFTTNFTITVIDKTQVEVSINNPPKIIDFNAKVVNNSLTATIVAIDDSNDTLSYLWEKLDGSATIVGSTNLPTIQLTNYQPSSPVTLKITVSDEHNSSVSRIFKSDGATVIRTLELKGLYSENNKLYGINGDGRVVFLKNNIKFDTLYPKIKDPIILDGLAYFTDINNTLWKSNGTEAGTIKIKKFNSFISDLTTSNGILFFSADDGNGTGLWKSDGTEIGTVMLKDIYPDNLIDMNGTLYCSHAGIEIWKSDGTESGTVKVKRVGSMSYIGNITEKNGILYFGVVHYTYNSVYHHVNYYEWNLWKSDGTEAGTVMVKDINSSRGRGASIGSIVVLNDKLYFSANDEIHGDELWRSDGTESGTVIVKDINSNPDVGSLPNSLTDMNGILYFSANDGVHGRELWRSDGTEAGTVMVKDINSSGSASVGGFVVLNNKLYFSANDGIYGDELWRSDGTESGTVIVKDINPNGDSNLYNLTNINGTLYFVANDGSGKTLWKSDGTEVGTVKVPLP